MTDPTAPETALNTFGDLPMQPSGSGVADLEIAYEQMRLAEEAGADDIGIATGATDETDDAANVSIALNDAAEDSAAHPS